MRCDVEVPGLAVEGVAVATIETNIDAGRRIFAWLQLADGRLAYWQYEFGAVPGEAQVGPRIIPGAA